MCPADVTAPMAERIEYNGKVYIYSSGMPATKSSWQRKGWANTV